MITKSSASGRVVVAVPAAEAGTTDVGAADLVVIVTEDGHLTADAAKRLSGPPRHAVFVGDIENPALVAFVEDMFPGGHLVEASRPRG